jgi:hypothetical protein
MTSWDPHGFLRAQKGELERLIAGCDPEDVSRIGFESRLAEVDAALARVATQQGRVGEATLLFRGAPVVGTRGIEAAFAGHAIESFQKLVSKMSASKSGRRLGERGPIPGAGDSRLFVTDTAPGSFGFVLREMPEQVPLLGASALAVSVEAAVGLLARAASSDDEFADAAVETDPGVLEQLDDFLRVIAERGATMRVISGDTVASLDDAETMTAARERAHSRRVEEQDVPEHGVLEGLLPSARRFELRTSDGAVIGGRLGPAVDIAAAQQLVSHPVAGRLHVVTIVRRDRETKRYVLQNVTADRT